VKRRAEVVSLEVRVDVAHDEAAVNGLLDLRQSRHVVERREKRRRRREEPVEVATVRIEARFHVCHTTIARNHMLRDMTLRALDMLEEPPTALRFGGDLAAPGLEVVEQVELEIVHDGRIDFTCAARRAFDVVGGAIEHHTCRRHHTRSSVGRGEI
jgi:hypothetical protein